MIEALLAVGIPGVTVEGGVIYARLPVSGAAFTAEPEGAGWSLALCWPVRASAGPMTGFQALHPGTEMDIWRGETRLQMQAGPDDLARWTAVAESAVVAMIGWRHRQRSPGEGMEPECPYVRQWVSFAPNTMA